MGGAAPRPNAPNDLRTVICHGTAGVWEVNQGPKFRRLPVCSTSAAEFGVIGMMVSSRNGGTSRVVLGAQLGPTSALKRDPPGRGRLIQEGGGWRRDGRRA